MKKERVTRSFFMRINGEFFQKHKIFCLLKIIYTKYCVKMLSNRCISESDVL